MGFQMFSFQPAAYVGSENRWEDGFCDVTDDAVWEQISAGVGPRPVMFVMHSFIDAADVGPAWDLLKRDEVSDDPRIRAAQERLEACTYAMGHPETGEVVPACVQHSVLDPGENRKLVELLPMRPR